MEHYWHFSTPEAQDTRVLQGFYSEIYSGLRVSDFGHSIRNETRTPQP